MIDLSVSGALEKDMVVFSLNGESKAVDPFTKQIHFSLEEKKTYRLYFEQKPAQYIPRCAEILLNMVLLPIRGIFNVLTFHTIQTWEEDISAFRVSGCLDICLDRDTEISFEWKPGKFEKQTNTFYKPTISFSPDMQAEQTFLPDEKEIIKNYRTMRKASARHMFFSLPSCFICHLSDSERDVHCRYRDFRTPDRLPYPDIWFNLTQLPKTNPPGIRFHRATYPKNKMNTSRYFFLRTSFRGAEFSLTFLPKNDIMQSVKTTANRKNTKI